MVLTNAPEECDTVPALWDFCRIFDSMHVLVMT